MVFHFLGREALMLDPPQRLHVLTNGRHDGDRKKEGLWKCPVIFPILRHIIIVVIVVRNDELFQSVQIHVDLYTILVNRVGSY